MKKKPTTLHLADLPGGPPKGTLLVELHEIADHGGKSVLFHDGDRRISLLVQIRGDKAFIYENSCPHAGTPLNLFGEKFLTIDGSYLICRTHGAQFTLEEGRCILGPCKGDYLRPVAFEEKEGALYSA
ncbi:MAG: Rieske 2Fe-2S domain-containing protein [Kordiimonadaceae bacterium]|nr:Rieske 2Fe-2S domain-containing protein [Kordiimonadaceae bacterium]